MEALLSVENSPCRKNQQYKRDRYPFVTSIREPTSWQSTARKTSPTVHLLSYMAEFVDEECEQPQPKTLELNQF